MPGQTTETAVESYVEEVLLTKGGWVSGTNAEWDKARALFPAQVSAFLEDTQPKLWEEMRKLHGSGLGSLSVTTLAKEFDCPVGNVETGVERLQEYRTALITAAVTGKIDVRESARATRHCQIHV